MGLKSPKNIRTSPKSFVIFRNMLVPLYGKGFYPRPTLETHFYLLLLILHFLSYNDKILI